MAMEKDVKPEVLKQSIAFEAFTTIKQERLRYPNGHEQDYFSLVTRPEGAVIIPYTPQKTLLITREYRHPTGEYLMGCIGGFVDEGETPLEAARRELMEEAGYTAENFDYLGVFYPYPSLTGQKAHFFTASNAVKQGDAQPEPMEMIQIMEVTEGEIASAIRRGVPMDNHLCSALYLLNR